MNLNTYTTINFKKALALAAALFAGNGLSAQSNYHDRVHIGLMYPVSTHGTHAPLDTNIFSFHVLGGVSAEEKSFTFAGVSNVIRHNAKGLQFAGLSNHVGGKSEGLLFSGFANTYGEGKGLQFAGFTNVARKDAEGLQFAGFLNKSANITGAQFAGFANVAAKVKGPQFAGFSNTAKSFEGGQAAGFVNVAGGNSTGSQFAGFINKAGNITGSQFAGFINVAKKVKGAQFAGFINVADSSDHPIALINIIKNGEKSIGLSIDETETGLLSFRSGGRALYGIVGVGYNFKNNDDVYAFEAGFGAHFPLTNSFRVNTELAAVMLQNFRRGDYFKGSFRLLPAVTFARHFNVFAGPVANFVNTSTSEGRTLVDHYIYTHTNRNNYFRGFYIGYTGGVQVLF